MSKVETFKVSGSGQFSLPAAARRRWGLANGGPVDVIDLGFGVLTVPAGSAGRLVDELLSASQHYSNVAADEDADLATS